MDYVFPQDILLDDDCADRGGSGYLTAAQLAHLYEVKYNLVYNFLLNRETRKVLEIGTRAGYAAEAFLSAGALSYTGVDAEYEQFWGRKGVFLPALEMLRSRHPRKNVDGVLGDSHQTIVQGFVGMVGPFDLIFLDADQTYDGMLQDLRDYSKMLRPNGMIIVDAPCRTCESDDAVEEFLNESDFSVRFGEQPWPNGEVTYERDIILYHK